MNTPLKHRPFTIAWIAIFTIFFGTQIFCQNNNTGKVNWTISPADHKAFIENRGQFNSDVKEGDKILYQATMGGIKVYFTTGGLLYKYNKVQEASSQLDEDDPANMADQVPEAHTIEEKWLGSNPNVVIKCDERQSDYYTFLLGDNTTIKTYAYKKITYQDLYPGIDVVYTFPENKEGIEYSFLIHPGADISKIKMMYDGASSISRDINGNINISMVSEGVTDILDHAPQSFYTDNKNAVSSSFSCNGNIVTFNIDSYDKTKEITIDPWTINPAFTTQDKAFDIAVDNAGNIYAYGGGGGGSFWLLKKFTSLGVPVWTFTTTYASWFGAIAVDGAGNSYITEGCCGGGIQKINTAGTSVWDVNNGVYEYWDLAFNSAFTNLYLGCGYSAGAIPAESVSFLNTATGAITGSVALNSGGSEPRSMVVAPNNNLYFLTPTAGAGGNDVLGVTPAFTNIFSVANGYALLYNGPLYANGSNTTSGENGIAASKTTFIATTNGSTLMKRNITTGALINSLAIPGGSTENNSGILIDPCGNIYVGSQAAVYEYDSLLNPITNVATSGAVYDLYYLGGGQVIASGNGFISSLALPVCGVVLPVQLIDFSCSDAGHGITLNWSTATETNNKYFTIERSSDGINFTPIRQVPGAGNSNQTLNYSYTDTNALNGVNYYRLSQTDLDGKTQTFNITSCSVNNLVAGSIFPNPASGSFTVTLGPSAQAQLISIYDVLGRNMYNQQFPPNDSYSNHIIDVPHLKGVYLVHITGGAQNIVRKLILN